MLLEAEKQAEIREAIVEKRPEDFGIPGKLWTPGRTRQYIQERYHKEESERRLSDYMKRWGMSCQRPAKRAETEPFSHLRVAKGGSPHDFGTCGKGRGCDLLGR